MPPKQREGFNAKLVELLLKRAGLIGRERSHDELLGNDEWWLTDLSRNVPMCPDKLRAWTVRGWVHGRQTPIQKNWILWADDDELARLRALVAESSSGRGRTSYPPELTTPKARA